MRCATLMVTLLLAVFAPADPAAQSEKVVFADHYADVNGMRLHYTSAGNGPLILFLHIRRFIEGTDFPRESVYR
jgi:hypothetical protein